MRRRFLLMPVFGLILAGSATLSAQTPNLPSVTVVRFEPDPMTELSPEDGEAVADELARQLVDSRQYRVLQREWLPAPRTDGPLPLDALRKAAASADVEYLVIGTVSRSFGSPAPPRPLMPANPAHFPRGSRTDGPSRVMLDVRVIDVGTGEVVRTAMATCKSTAPRPTLSRASAPIALVAPRIARSPVGAAVVAFTAIRAKPPRLDSGLQRAIVDTAKALSRSASQLAQFTN